MDSSEFKIQLEFSQAEVIIIVNQDIRKGFDYTLNKYPCVVKDCAPDEDVDAYVYKPDNIRSIFLYIESKRIPRSILVHELQHLNYYILSEIGIELSNATDEVYAYHFQMLYEKITKVLK